MNVKRVTHTNCAKFISLPSGEFFYYDGELFLKINDTKAYDFSKGDFHFCFYDNTKVIKVNKDDISITFSV